jgi:hypothetical protein
MSSAVDQVAAARAQLLVRNPMIALNVALLIEVAEHTIQIVFYYVARTMYRLIFHTLAKVPGPWCLAISSLPHSYFVTVSGQWHIINRTLHDRYGAIVRVAPNKINVRGEIGWKAVYAHRTQDIEEWPKAEDFFFWHPPDIVTAPTATHRRMRKEIIRAFSDKAICEQQPIFRQ